MNSAANIYALNCPLHRTLGRPGTIDFSATTREIEVHTSVTIRCRIANFPPSPQLFGVLRFLTPPASRGTRPPPTGPARILR